MMSTVVADRPSLYLPQEDIVLSYSERGESIVSLKEVVACVANTGLQRLTRLVLSRVFSKATSLGISFQILEIQEEQDVEIPSWTYSVVRVGLRIAPELFPWLEDLLVQEGHRGLKVEESLKVLLTFEDV